MLPSLLSAKRFIAISYKLCRSNVKLRSYTGDRVPVLGSIKVPVRSNGGESQNMEVLVVKGDRPSLFGRDWLAQTRLDWKGIFRVSESPVESEFMGTSEWPKGFAKAKALSCAIKIL